MSPSAFHARTLAGLLIFGSPFLAHSQAASIANPGIAATTAIVGVAATQTARLNVLNLQPVIPGITATLCPATLEFYDDSGALLKQLAVTNISPGTAASLLFKPPVPSATARAQIRAVVLTPSTPVLTGPPVPVLPPIMPVYLSCNVMTSLEIIDDSTGATHTFTTDLRAMLSYGIFPMMAVP